MAKPNNITAALVNWSMLNMALQECNEKQCEELLKVESTSKARAQFMLRIYGRFNKMRTQRERLELIKLAR